jgi:hypothetical protein
MATSEERRRILKLVEEGKLTPEQGVQLLNALTEAAKDKRDGAPPPPPPPPGSARFVRIRVTNVKTGHQEVNLRIPTGFVNWIFRAGGKVRANINGVDSDAVMEAIRARSFGHVVDVRDGNDRVEIVLE